MNMREAIDQWRKCANDTILYPNVKLRDSCERAAKSLEIERDTGVAVCSCCFKTYDECLNRIRNRR